MTKKHFRALAALMFEQKPEIEERVNDAYLRWDLTCGGIADVCAQANPNFNREKFLTACREGL